MGKHGEKKTKPFFNTFLDLSGFVCVMMESNTFCWTQPLADAIFYKNADVIKILETHGAKHPVRMWFWCFDCVSLHWKINIYFNILPKKKNIYLFVIVDIFCMFQMAPMHVKTPREVPEYEINPSELDFTQSKEITKV